VSKLIISTTTTVDGLMDVAEWFVAEGDHEADTRGLFDGDTALLMGRKTYEGLAAYWPSAEGEWADLLNPMRKFVASRTLSGSLEWNSTLLDGEIEESVPKLKEQLGGNLVQIGAGELARDLLAAGLIDELWFWVHPAVWGDGARPLEGEQLRLRLVESKGYGSGVTLLRYEPAA
jgi:dihydrofolate reductase